MSKQITFFGGPLDLTRVAVDSIPGRRYVAATASRPVGVPIQEGAIWPSPVFGTAVYRLGLAELASDPLGDEQWVGVFEKFSSQDSRLASLTAENSRLRTANETLDGQRLGAEAKVRLMQRANVRLSNLITVARAALDGQEKNVETTGHAASDTTTAAPLKFFRGIGEPMCGVPSCTLCPKR